MVVGQQNNLKVGFIVQARMKSNRFPGKILMPLPLNGDKPMLKRIVDWLKISRHDHKIILATSIKTENDLLETFSEKEEIGIYRGSEEDVLSRFVEICKHNSFDVIVRLTADNPFIDVRILDELIFLHFNEKNKYTRSKNLPLGMNFEIIDPNTIVNTPNENLSANDREHVTLYIKENYPTRFVEFKVPEAVQQLRLTIDYPSDYALSSFIYMFLDNQPKGRNDTLLDQISKITEDNIWLKEINTSNFQKKQFSNKEDEINEAVRVLETLDLDYSAQLLRKSSFADNT